jgi:hypothetical protein
MGFFITDSDLQSGAGARRGRQSRPAMAQFRGPSRCGAALVWSVALALTAAVPAVASPRSWQPLLLRGVQLAGMRDTRVDRLEVLAVHSGRLEPIPFQIDAVLPDGMFALEQGPNPTPGAAVQTVGDDDELAIMMFDLGERAADETALPAGTRVIKVADPLGGPDRYAYIAAVKHPRLSPVHYVDYEPGSERIETERYRLGFKRQLPDDFRLQNRRGERSKNLISGFELRGKVTVLSLLQFHLTESDIDSRLLAYRVGPVRVIRRLGHRIRVFLGIHSPEVSTVEFFYREIAQAPFTMRFPLRKLFRDVQGRIAMDFLDLSGYELLASGLEAPLDFGDGAVARRIAGTAEAPAAQWLALRGGGRLMLQTFAPSAELELIKRRLYYRGLPSVPAGRAQSSAVPAAVGIQTDGWERLGGGSHRFNPLLISVPASYGAEHVIAEATAAPAVTVRPLGETDQFPPDARNQTYAPSSMVEDGK